MELWEESGVDGDEELENMLGCLLDFPMESLEGDGVVADWESQQLGPIPMDVFVPPPMLARSIIDVGPPVFMHTPPPLNKSDEVQETGTFQSQSPVSVLENSGSSLLLNSHVAKRTRSKRARPSGLGPWLVISPPFSADAKRTKGWRPTTEDSSGTARVISHAKKCTHCEITKTPQWREGPLGPKTLCNACGVRFRSGRLFPEYRPAASPTFVPSLHSNSHKKVIEMRNKDKVEVEFIPASGYLF